MLGVSSREFRDNQKKYFDQVDKKEQVVVQRGKDKAYLLKSLNDADRLSENPEFIRAVKQAEKKLAKGEKITIKDPEKVIFPATFPVGLIKKTGLYIG